MRGSLLGGVASVSAAAVLLALAWTRLTRTLFGGHVAFAVAALALLGLGLGGAVVYARRGPGSARGLGTRLTMAAAGVAASSAVALLALMRAPLVVVDARTLLELTVLLALATSPFVFTGAALAAALRDVGERAGSLCAAMWLGAALGGAGASVAVELGPPRTVLVAAFVAALAAAVFGGRAPRRTGEVELVVTLLLSPAVLLVSDVMAPWLKLPVALTAPRAEVQAWTELGRVTVDRPMGGKAWVRVDGGSTTALLDAKAAVLAEPADLAYALSGAQGPTLIVAPGGGRDVRAALDAQQTDIHVVEPSRHVAEELVRGRYGVFTGGLYDRPEVHVAVASPRSYVARSATRYRNIVVSQRDDTDADRTGELAIRSSELFTVEAVRELLGHLTPEGTLTLSAPSGELERLFALAVAALRATGATEPLKHLFATSLNRSTSLLIAAAPLSTSAVETLRGSVRRRRTTEVLAPDALAPALTHAARVHAPPTDDRPYFHVDPARARPAEVLRARSTWPSTQGLWALVLLLAVGAVGAALTLAPPLVAGGAGQGRLRGLAFFAAQGAGSALAAVALLGRFTDFVGGASSILLVVGLLSAAIGSVAATPVPLERAAFAARWRAAALVVLFASLAVGLGPALGELRALGLAARLAAALAVVVPLGLLLGGLWPLGARLVASRAAPLVPACVGVWGSSALLAAGAGTWLLLSVGSATALLVAGWLWFVAAAVTPRRVDALEQGR